MDPKLPVDESLVLRAQAWLASIVESSGDGIFATMLDGTIVSWNGGAERLFGWFAEEIIGRNDSVLAPPDEVAAAEAARARIRRGERVAVLETTRRHKDGRLVWVSMTLSPIRDESRRVIALSTIARDIGDRKRAEAELRTALQRERELRGRLETLLQADIAISDAIISMPLLDLRAVLQAIVEQAQRLTGARHAAIGIGSDPDRPFDPWVYAGMTPDEASAIGRTPRPIGTLSAVARDGRTVNIGDVRAHPSFSGLPHEHPQVASFLGVPIAHRGRPVGNLFLADKQDGTAFTEEDVRLIEQLAARSGVALHTAQLYRSEQAQRAWLQGVLDQLPEGVMVVDAEGRVRHINEAARRLAAGPTGQVDEFGNDVTFDVRRPSGEPLPFDELPLVRALREKALISGVELAAQTSDGRLLPLLASAVPLRGLDHAFTGAVVVFQDLTELKELQRLRDEWISVMAHDLRQPISATLLAAHNLRRLRGQDATPQEHGALRSIGASMLNMERLVDDLLDTSLIAADRLTLVRSDIEAAPLVRGIAARFAHLAEAFTLNVIDDTGGARLLADPARFEQVLVNLLSNAAKYGERGTAIEVRLVAADGGVAISVSNRGRGIPPDELGTLFTRFRRSSASRESGVGGLGLGLYICKGIVDAHGGRIEARSTPGQTTTLTLWLPGATPDER